MTRPGESVSCPMRPSIHAAVFRQGSNTAVSACLCPGAVPVHVAVPLPHRPYPFQPQHFRVWLLSSPEGNLYPHGIERAVLPLPRSTVGRRSPICPADLPRSVLSPSPSPPSELPPQHLTDPSSRTAHVWPKPEQ